MFARHETLLGAFTLADVDEGRGLVSIMPRRVRVGLIAVCAPRPRRRSDLGIGWLVDVERRGRAVRGARIDTKVSPDTFV